MNYYCILKTIKIRKSFMEVIKYLWKELENFTREKNSVVNTLRSYFVKLTNVVRKSNTGHSFLINLIYEKGKFINYVSIYIDGYKTFNNP